MKDDTDRTKEQLVDELTEMRQQVAKLEALQVAHERMEKELRESRARFQDLYENAPNAYFTVGADGLVQRCNKRAGELLGYTVEELVGRPVFELYTDTSQGNEKAWQVFQRFRAGEVISDEELQMRRVDGTPIWVSLTVGVVRDDQGQVVESRSMVVDITKRKQAEEALRRERGLLSQMMETSPVGITVVDREGRITFANREAERVLGLTRDEITERTYNAPEWRITDCDGNPFPDKELPFRQVMDTGRAVFGVCHAIVWPDEQRVFLSINAAPLFDTAGQVDGMVATVEDITERRRVEEEIRGLAKFPDENPAPVLRVSQDGIILYANASSLPLLNLWRSQIGQRLPDDWREFVFDVIRSGLRKDVEVECEDRIFLLTFAPIIDMGYVNVYGLDITERKRVEEDLSRLATVVEQATETVVITDLDGNIVYANPYYEVSTGYTVSEALGQNPRILKSGHQDRAFYQKLWETITQGRTWRGTFINRGKNGNLYHEAATIFPIKGATGGTINYAAVKRDVTEQVRAEEAVRRRNRELALLNRVGQQLAATLDLQRVAEQLLRAVTEIVGTEGASVWLWDREQEGWLVCQVFFHHGLQHSLTDLRLGPGQGIAGWVAQRGESVIVADAPNDSRFFSGIDEQTGFHTRSLIAVPLRVRGTVTGVLEAVNKQQGDFDKNDLALVETLAASAAIAIENARLVEALRQRSIELEAHNEELDAFAHTAAHDLKGPLAPLVGYAEILMLDYEKIIDPDGLNYLRKIAQGGRKMTSIVDELLLLAGARKMDVDVEPLDMSGIVDDVQQRLAYMIEEYQTEIILPEAWPTALGYGPWVEEVWANYVSNGIKYGGKPPCVELGATVRPDGMVRFWVRDDGLGLTLEEQARLFTPFTRLDQVRVKGHGLGLSIVRRIVERLGGEVGVESKVDQGSVFYFTLPMWGGSDSLT